jgi:hypothetical protein
MMSLNLASIPIWFAEGAIVSRWSSPALVIAHVFSKTQG